MENTLLTAFLQNTYSTYQARKHLLILKHELEKRFFNSQQKSEDTESAQDSTDTMWLTSLDEDFFKPFNQMNAYQVLDDLEKEIKKNPTITLFIAFTMPEEEINRLGVWLRIHMVRIPNLLCEIKIDPNLLAGCALSFKGIYKDYSLMQRIEANKQQIIANLKNYLK